MLRDALSDRARTIVCLAALGGLAVVSRLPQLLSPNLLVDGDEAVLGLMAKHLLERHELPIFFWGQQYGLSSIEAAAAALSFRWFGAGPVPLKAAMLALWIVGVLFLFAALASVVGRRRGFWIASVFVLTPAWAVWSMKARGGYLTAFAATAILVWLVVPHRSRDRVARWIGAGVLTALVYLAQPLWLAGVLPIVAAILIARKRAAAALAYAAAAGAPIVAVRIATAGAATAWSGPGLWNPSLWGMRVRIAEQVYVNLTGSYYLTSAIDPPGRATIVLGGVWYAILPLLAGLQLYRLVTKRRSAASHLLFASICATIVANWVLLFARDARYMLPLAAALVPLAAIELLELVDRRVLPRVAAVAITTAALLLGAASMVEFRGFSYLWPNAPHSPSESKRLQQVIGALVSRDATHVFSMNGLLDTQLIFYSGERIVARGTSATDRHPAYVAAVDRALAAGEPVAVVGYTDTSGAPGCWDVPICTGGIDRLVPNPEAIFTIDGKYFVYVGATRDLLRRLHFDLPD